MLSEGLQTKEGRGKKRERGKGYIVHQRLRFTAGGERTEERSGGRR